MNKLQQAMFDHYKDVAALMTKNNIKYFAIGGTAIGAIREHGFIDWDDDIDIAIFEEDMDKFKKVMQESEFQLTDSKKDAWRPFYKIGAKEKMMEQFGKKVFLNIDVFIAYKKRKVGKSTFIYRDILRFLMWLKTNNGKTLREGERAVGNKVVWLWYLGISIVKYLVPILTRRSKWQQKMFNLFKNKKIIDDGKRYFYHSDPFHKVLTLTASNLKSVKFEDGKMPVTSDFANESVPVYGDIMVPYRDKKSGGSHGYKISEE